jgi:hypothetical protein
MSFSWIKLKRLLSAATDVMNGHDLSRLSVAGAGDAQASHELENSVLEVSGSSKFEESERDYMRIIKKGPAMRVIFFYPGEEGTYVDSAEVTLYEIGIVHITSNQEETTTHLQNCEILWRFETEAEERSNKVRLLKPKAESGTKQSTQSTQKLTQQSDEKRDGNSGGDLDDSTSGQDLFE